MAAKETLEQIDEALVVRVAALSRGSQRWLKTTLQTIFAADEAPAVEDAEPVRRTKGKVPPRGRPATLEDVVTGKADLREHLAAYPELSEELEGMADVIDLLREAGGEAEAEGEQILREEILGEEPEGEGGVGDR